MPKSLVNRKFLDISAFVKIDDDGKLEYNKEPVDLNQTEFEEKQQQRLGRIKLLHTPSSQY
jgi:hypothetical protein